MFKYRIMVKIKKINRKTKYGLYNANKLTYPINLYPIKIELNKHHLYQIGGDRSVKLWKKYGQKLVTKFKGDRTAPKNALLLPKEFTKADPTNGKYIEWLINSYLNDGILLFEDLFKVKTALNNYIYLIKNKYIIKDPSAPAYEDLTNILNFCGINGCKKLIKGRVYQQPGLYDIIDKYVDVLPKEKEILMKETDAEKIYEDEFITIIHPITTAGSCKYGKGTKWCTAASVAENRFADYNSQGPLFIIIPKDKPTEKYQIHFETNSLMDSKDKPYPLDQLLEKYPSVSILRNYNLKFPHEIRLGNVNNLLGAEAINNLFKTNKTELYFKDNLYSIYKLNLEVTDEEFIYIIYPDPDLGAYYKIMDMYILIQHQDPNEKYLIMVYNRNDNYDDIIIMNNEGKIVEYTMENIISILDLIEKDEKTFKKWFEKRHNLIALIRSRFTYLENKLFNVHNADEIIWPLWEKTYINVPTYDYNMLKNLVKEINVIIKDFENS